MIRISLYVSTIHIIYTVCVTHHVIGSQLLLLLYTARWITLGNYTVGGPVSLMTDDGNRLHRTITHCTHAPYGHTHINIYIPTYIYMCVCVCICTSRTWTIINIICNMYATNWISCIPKNWTPFLPDWFNLWKLFRV